MSDRISAQGREGENTRVLDHSSGIRHMERSIEMERLKEAENVVEAGDGGSSQ